MSVETKSTGQRPGGQPFTARQLVFLSVDSVSIVVSALRSWLTVDVLATGAFSVGRPA